MNTSATAAAHSITTNTKRNLNRVTLPSVTDKSWKILPTSGDKSNKYSPLSITRKWVLFAHVIFFSRIYEAEITVIKVDFSEFRETVFLINSE